MHGRSPGWRVGACVGLPEAGPQWRMTRLAADSRGGGCGGGRPKWIRPFRIPSSSPIRLALAGNHARLLWGGGAIRSRGDLTGHAVFQTALVAPLSQYVVDNPAIGAAYRGIPLTRRHQIAQSHSIAGIITPRPNLRFSRLRLNGFKSFVDPTDLVINEGLTGVVGPNGCGKSNLLEALRWVMGENRPTAMRGGGMEDVIFSGTSSRPARNHAEVTLTIDNSEHLAPAVFNEAETLEIVRRITRDAGSAYKVSGKEVRARDVQMLFADASTGAQSPALVRQGQISELINAKPKARRRILEEAAGISGLYQRRHEAELKLRGAEQNLTRVDDVIEQLAGQLAQLARQARQAARYREIGSNLRHSEGLLLYRRWHEAEAAQQLAEAALREKLTATAQAESVARDSEAARQQTEDALPPHREEEAIAAAVLQRLEIERESLTEKEKQARGRIQGLTRRLEQIERDRTREAGLNDDARGSITQLEAEEADLVQADDGHAQALDTAMEQVQEASTILSDRESALSAITEEVARLAARHQSANRLISDSRKTLERNQAEAETAAQAQEQAKQAHANAAAEVTAAQEQVTTATATAQRADDALRAAENARSASQAKDAEARAAASEAEGAVNALRAEVSALSRLVERDSGDGEQLMDVLRVARGYEKALGAALADDLKAPIAQGAGSGWVDLPAYGQAQSLPDGAEPLSDYVNAPGLLARRLSQVGVMTVSVTDAHQAALLPGQRLVSADGDLWRWDGYRSTAEDAPSAAALRLQQRNRLIELQNELAGLEKTWTTARDAHQAVADRLKELTQAEQSARTARREADSLVAEANRRLNRADADRTLAEGKLESSGLAVARHQEDAAHLKTALAEAEAALAELDDLEASRDEAESLKVTVEAARMTMIARRSAHDELRREGELRTRRREQVEAELTRWRQRLANASERGADLNNQQQLVSRELEKAQSEPAKIVEAREGLVGQITDAETRRKAAADALATAEGAAREAAIAERDAQRLASEAREAKAAAEARRDASREGVNAAADRIRELAEVGPADLLERLDVTPDQIPESEALEIQVAQLKRQRDSLGAVNLRAEEDAIEVQTEHDGLVKEKADLEEAISTLRSGISALNREGRERLLTAFDEVNTSFGNLFKHLFGGGEAKLVLVESDDPLDAGLEIMCQPPGKKLSTLSLLSGGEQTLTAMALIFAVFLANPAPICVLDEVDAPLDDANVGRFCDLLDEMTRQTQTRFLIITHHAVTMSRMDRLFGVTMQEQGVSQLVSVDLKKAEAMVA